MSIIEFSSGIQADTSFVSFQSALEYVFKLAEKERIILTIDEYPYAVLPCPTWRIMCLPIRHLFMEEERRR